MATSQLKQAILDIKAKVLTNASFVYCAMFNNQVKQEQDGKTFDFLKPAVLIEIDSPQSGVTTLGPAGVTVSDFSIRLSIVHEQLNATYLGTAGSGMDENLDIFDLRDSLKTLMTGFKPTNCSNLQYESESQDYAHNSIYVYGITFKCSFVDTKGSPLDADSTVWVNGEIEDVNLNVFLQWLPNKNYVENNNAVVYDDNIYLCAVDNSDAAFDTDNWTLINVWEPDGPYTATTDYVAYQNHIYQCLTTNTDATFILSKWTKIV